VLDRARAGVYSQFEVQRGLPIQMLIKYFTQVGEMWEVSPVIRDMVRYQRLNLLDDFSRLGVFDLVFCRNVLIYLDQETKADIMTRIARVTDPSGHLILGSAETVVGLANAWKPHDEHRGLFTLAKPSMPSPRLSVLGGVRG
jgi:chemotaxis protein methyltransferase CheR